MAPPTSPPAVAVRLVATYAETTRRVDLQVAGGRGLVVEDGRVTPFEVEQLWPTVRALLPAVAPLRADPTGRRGPAAPGTPGLAWAERCRAMVSLATVSGLEAEPASVAVRTWFATDDELWSATPLADGTTDLRLATPGDLAELLVWDVTGALESLVHAFAEPAR